MGTTADKLLYLQDTKSAIKDAIVAKGVTVPTGTAFRDYANKIGSITSGGGSNPTADVYVRPTEWLDLPDNINGVQKVSILNAVFNTDSEFVAFTCAGAYTVDWGDGVVENFTTGIKAEHKYDYSNANLNSATVSKFGYKQCIITITPQSGQNLTELYLNTYHSIIDTNSSSYNTQTGFLGINANIPFGTTNAIRIASSTGGVAYVKHSLLERVNIGQVSTSFVSMAYQFLNCYSLQSVEFGFDTTQITSWNNTFNGCYKLQKCPDITFRTTGITSCDTMFSNCYSLVEVPEFDIVLSSNGTIGSMFLNCYSLEKVVLNVIVSTNVSLASTFSNCVNLNDVTLTLTGGGKINSLSITFSGCQSLKVLPELDTSACTNFANAFANTGIVTLPNYNYLAATTLASMCIGSDSLVNVPDITISSSCTNLTNTFNSCTSLTKAPNITGGTNVVTLSSIFSGCTSLVSVPSYSFPIITTAGLGTMFSNCGQLSSLPTMNFGTSYTSNGSFCSNDFALKRMLIPLRFTFSVANAKMSAAALNEMYSILPTVTGQTVTVTGNYGVSGDDPSIATSRGWTVVG